MSKKIPMHDIVSICETRIHLGMPCFQCVYKAFRECPRFGTPDAKSISTIRDNDMEGSLSKEQLIKQRLERYDAYFNMRAHISGVQ